MILDELVNAIADCICDYDENAIAALRLVAYVMGLNSPEPTIQRMADKLLARIDTKVPEQVEGTVVVCRYEQLDNVVS